MISNQEEIQIVQETHKATLKYAMLSDNAMLDYSRMSLRGTMILNGAGIIPIVYSQVTSLYNAAFWFAIGALLSVCASGFSYLTQWIITTGWHTQAFILYPFRTSPLDEEEVKAARKAKISYSCLPYFRFCSILLVVLSLCCFGFGLYKAHDSLFASPSNIQSQATK